MGGNLSTIWLDWSYDCFIHHSPIYQKNDSLHLRNQKLDNKKFLEIDLFRDLHYSIETFRASLGDIDMMVFVVKPKMKTEFNCIRCPYHILQILKKRKINLDLNVDKTTAICSSFIANHGTFGFSTTAELQTLSRNKLILEKR